MKYKIDVYFRDDGGYPTSFNCNNIYWEDGNSSVYLTAQGKADIHIPMSGVIWIEINRTKEGEEK